MRNHTSINQILIRITGNNKLVLNKFVGTEISFRSFGVSSIFLFASYKRMISQPHIVEDQMNCANDRKVNFILLFLALTFFIALQLALYYHMRSFHSCNENK